MRQRQVRRRRLLTRRLGLDDGTLLLAQLRLEAHEVQRDPREGDEEGLQLGACLQVHMGGV